MHTNLAHETQYEMNAKELAKREKVSVRAIGIPYAKLRAANHPLFVDQFDCNAPLTEDQINILRPGKFTAKKAVKHSASVPSTDEPMILDTGRQNEVAPPKVEVRRWALWAALIVTAGASVPNMVEVTTAIKGSSLVAWALTAVFTVVPGLLIAARLRGFLWLFVVIGVMGYTAFCNAASIFGGLTELDKGYVLRPTVFLEAVTNLLNTDYLNTARAIAAFMALALGAIEYLAFKNLAK